MAGYIGSKAVTLSTTAADVAGNAVIDGNLTVKGTTVTVDSAAVQEIRLGDNDKMTFGDATGGDLQIYHNGSHSYISDQGTGRLYLQASNDLFITNADGTENKAIFTTNGESKFFYDGAAKLATTSTGVDITGGVTTDAYSYLSGLRISGADTGNTVYQQSGDLSISSASGSISLKPSGTNILHATNTGVGIGTSSPTEALTVTGGNIQVDASSRKIGFKLSGNSNAGYLIPYSSGGNTELVNERSGGSLIFKSANTERMRIDSSGNLLVSKTSKDFGVTVGIELGEDGALRPTRDSSAPLIANRRTNHGDVILIVQENTTRGTLGTTSGGRLYIQSDGGANLAGIEFSVSGTSMTPRKNGASSDNEVDVGSATFRWDDVYATNGTIQTSDQNEKQQIASLTDAEITAAKAISKLFKTFKWNDSVAEKGDAARTHTGVIAQEVEQAMTDAGLNAGDYGFFISTTWWETQTEVPAVEAAEAVEATYDEEGNVLTEAVEAVEAQEAYTRTDTYHTAEEAPEGATERNRKGIRYPQLLSFIGATTEQRLASIESRLDALEGN